MHIVIIRKTSKKQHKRDMLKKQKKIGGEATWNIH